MRQSKLVLLLSVFLTSLLLACSEPSIQDDAKTAAELSRLSNESALKNDMSRASELYGEAQQIIEKYRRSEHFEEFYELYSGLLEENSTRNLESANPMPDGY